MNKVLTCLALFAGQMNTLQSKPVVHLRPHTAQIGTGFSGKLLKLSNGPTIVFLPVKPPSTDNDGNPWEVDVMNLGPAPVTVRDPAIPSFMVIINVNQTMHFSWNGSTYLATR